jgi:hypothetical protein
MMIRPDGKKFGDCVEIDHWENLNIFTQTFDEYGKLTVFHRDFWSNNRWTDFSTDSLFYDQNGNLSERSAS